jgi:signal peptidase
MRILRKATQLLGQLLVLAFVAFALLVFIGIGIGPRTSTYRTMTVLTGSMGATLPPGSVAVQTPMDVGDVKVGDVISYRIPVDDHRLVTHRVVKILERGASPVVVTKGDANNAPDPWFPRLEAGRTWKTRFGIPRAGYAVQFLRSPEVHRATVLAIPVVLALIWLRGIWAPRERAHAA